MELICPRQLIRRTPDSVGVTCVGAHAPSPSSRVLPFSAWPLLGHLPLTFHELGQAKTPYVEWPSLSSLPLSFLLQVACLTVEDVRTVV